MSATRHILQLSLKTPALVRTGLGEDPSAMTAQQTQPNSPPALVDGSLSKSTPEMPFAVATALWIVMFPHLASVMITSPADVPVMSNSARVSLLACELPDVLTPLTASSISKTAPYVSKPPAPETVTTFPAGQALIEVQTKR